MRFLLSREWAERRLAVADACWEEEKSSELLGHLSETDGWKRQPFSAISADGQSARQALSPLPGWERH